ncbi:MAG TPA: hypothetical protein VKE93_18990 [Candidatus Angelobacter sp.]|nr:hypothetical protein [Candidatus Angelobacter sp.]
MRTGTLVAPEDSFFVCHFERSATGTGSPPSRDIAAIGHPVRTKAAPRQNPITRDRGDLS